MRTRTDRSGRGPAVVMAFMWLTAVLLSACAVPPPVDNADRVALAWSKSVEPAFENVVYGPDPANVVDIYTPLSGGNRGVMVLVHGGAFSSGTREEMLRISGLIMSQLDRGFGVVNVSYRLLTKTSNFFPTAVDDASLVVDWVKEHGADHGLNPRTVIIAGHSAGATVAALVALGSNSPTSGPLGRTARVDGYISLAGVMDFETEAPAARALGRGWLGSNAEKPGWIAAASPVAHLDPADPPGFLAQGDLDTLVDKSQIDQMVIAMLRSGTPARRLFIDKVTTGEYACRWHLPQCGVNVTQLNKWIDRIVRREL